MKLLWNCELITCLGTLMTMTDVKTQNLMNFEMYFHHVVDGCEKPEPDEP